MNTAITPDSEWTTNGIVIVETVKRKIPYLFVQSFLSSECINHQIKLTNAQDDDVELLEIEENNESRLYSKARSARRLLRISRQAPPIHIMVKLPPSVLIYSVALSEEQKAAASPLLKLLQTRSTAEINTLTRVAVAMFMEGQPPTNIDSNQISTTSRTKSNSPSKKGLEEAQRCSSLPKPKIAKQTFECCCCKRLFDNRYNHSAHETLC